MSNGYESGEVKKVQMVPTISLHEFEAEVNRIKAANQGQIDAQQKEIEDLRVVIESKRHRIASLDQEISDAIAKKRAEADLLVQEAKNRLSDMEAANRTAHELYESALKDAAQAKHDKKKAEEALKALEVERGVARARLNDATAQQDKLKEQVRYTDAKLAEVTKRELAADERDRQLDADAAEIASQATGVREARKSLDDAAKQVYVAKELLQQDMAALETAKTFLAVTQAERDAFNAAKAEMDAKVAGFAETDSRLTAIENRLKIDVQALKAAQADLERRRKNIESLESQIAKGA